MRKHGDVEGDSRGYVYGDFGGVEDMYAEISETLRGTREDVSMEISEIWRGGAREDVSTDISETWRPNPIYESKYWTTLN